MGSSEDILRYLENNIKDKKTIYKQDIVKLLADKGLLDDRTVNKYIRGLMIRDSIRQGKKHGEYEIMKKEDK